jgi:hypothetical protein
VAGVLRRPTSAAELAKLASAGVLWAVLDACDTPAVLARVTELGVERARCLYPRSNREEDLAAAPYLLSVEPDTLKLIVERLWGQPWGILAVARTDLQSLRNHFRTLLQVEGADGKVVYFRFYDPRVLGKYLPTCTPAEAKQVLGPCEALGVAGAEPGTAVLMHF